ncbi:MAG: hypothetical protein LBU12_02690 [Deltaproteobacteria bacterium]|jgi:phosphoribosylaminoimidazolecarboxamide formyltransferase/IMP cyclohydrolase|nr:hypothetical protein [Deltaproteobacteria bacterium]
MSEIALALLSVTDKTGLTELASWLVDREVKLLSTGGTATALRAGGFQSEEVGDFTGAGELLDGRVKTLHPKVHAGILHRRDSADHLAQMAQRGWPGVDLVVVNLYPFETVSERPEASFQEIVDNIDIGGPCLLRAAAKNHEHVAVLCDPVDYGAFMAECERAGGLSRNFRRLLAYKAFSRAADYDQAISAWLGRVVNGLAHVLR